MSTTLTEAEIRQMQHLYDATNGPGAGPEADRAFDFAMHNAAPQLFALALNGLRAREYREALDWIARIDNRAKPEEAHLYPQRALTAVVEKAHAALRPRDGAQETTP